MDQRQGLAWLGRKVGWGFAEGQLDEWVEQGKDEVIDRLIEPDDFDIAVRPDAFAGIERNRDATGRTLAAGLTSWLDAAAASPRPLETFMEFFWSDYFAVSFRIVRPPYLLFDHMNLLGQHATGNFGELLRAVTIDPSMLQFLDGRQNTRENPNENFGRELLELYTVGVDNFTEDDVKAASRALTGWQLRRRTNAARLVPARHDDTEQTLLGVNGVHDLDSTINAVLAHPATAARLVDKLATAILGPGYDTSLVEDLPEELGQSWELKPVVRRLLRLGVDGHAVPSILEPVPWYITARKLPLQQSQRPQLREFFALNGQLPMRPPNVGGFPEPDAYLSTSATIARFNMAAHMAEQADTLRSRLEPVEFTNDLDQLADRLGLVNGFAPATRQALGSLGAGVDRLAATLAAPDLVVV